LRHIPDELRLRFEVGALELTRESKMAKDPRSLQEYRSKRQFSTTPAPHGVEKHSETAGGIFCVQQHLASHLHFDFRLEHRGVLLSWAVPKGPSLNPRDKRLAMMTEDHPLDYGDFEGVIPEGYGSGVVMLWDRGRWLPLDDDVDAAIEKGQIKFELQGVKLKGQWVLVRSAGAARRFSPNQQDRAWLLIKHRDGWAGDVDVLTAAPLSVLSGKDLAGILLEHMPAQWSAPGNEQKGRIGKQLQLLIDQARGAGNK